ncbi:phosphatidate cytidylyltransferase [Vibrio sonorensis]|uniref:phosphatidate cytidylyltransferase n=1 Tax=Vibrio sonorensis TaxID=1004316 RepID=UPI0008DA5CEE|nr:phosphatidate cytidylyltransferase [Vibrio sonorensis]
MKLRIITALILAPLVILGIFELPLLGFVFAIAGVCFLGLWEWTQFVKGSSRVVSMAPSLIAIAALLYFVPVDNESLKNVSSSHYGILLVGSLWWIIASALVVTYPNSSRLWEGSRLLRHLFGFLTLVPFFFSVILLRAEVVEGDAYHGAKLVLFVCLLVWAADSGAYFSGKSLGRRKMAPQVSPNKTIEGLIGGVITALAVAWLAADWFSIEFSSPLTMVIITLATVVISVLGDLVESMFKRVSGIKDSSNIIPGHGGVLDRIDSLTAAFPVFAFLYFLF